MTRTSRRPPAGDRYEVEVLEPRLLLAADWLGALAPPWDDNQDLGHDRDATVAGLPEGLAALPGNSPLPEALDLNALLGLQPEMDPAPAADTSQRHELVVIDAGVEGYEQLVADFSARSSGATFYDVYVLAADADGVAALSDMLTGYNNLDALHIVSHGGDGAIQLGQTRLDTAGTDAYQTMLQGWSDALGEDADLMIYGCDLAGTADGQALAERLGALTGADVAASTDLTGNGSQGGDWDLEFITGSVDTTVAFSAHLQTAWSGVLATFVVDTVNDTVDANPGDGLARDAAGNTSLRAAIMEANALAGADIINLPSGTYTLTITGAGEDDGLTGDLDILQQLTITGANAANTVIDADDLDRVIDIIGAFDVSISGVTLQGGETGLTGGAINNQGGTLTLGAVTIRDNVANAGGGGIHNDGSVDLQSVTLSENESSGSGGAIYSTAGATMTALTNVTVSGNTASGTGGGLFFLSDADLLNVTITANTSGAGGGGINIDLGVTTLQNTIVAANSAGLGPDVRGTVVSDGSNIILDASDSSGFTAPEIGVDPMLDANLQYNGGPTQTHALLAGSPAIDAAASSPAPAVDQRGAMRDGMPDLGAYEFGGNTTPVANNDDYAVIFNTTLVVNAAGGLLANDTDFELDTLSVFLLTAPSNGTLTLNPQGLTGLDNLTLNAAVDGYPSWSPDSSQVAFASQRGGNYDIFVMNADGTGLTQLTSSPNDELQPVWSPDGTQILYQSDAATTFDIYVMDANGANPMRLTTGAISDGSNEYDARWSPDGSQIVYITELGNPSIWVMERDGSNPAQLTSPTNSETAPAWSPDGARIVFVSDAAGNEDIYVMDADGSNIMPLTTNAAAEGAPTWSPDGSKILFHSDRDGDFELFVMDADGSNVVQITDNPASDINGVWSPKGDRIAFQTDRSGNDEVFTSIIVSDGGFAYTPNDGFTGIDSFTYQVSDGTSVSAPAAVTLTVGNNPPAATNLTQSLGYLEDAVSLALGDIVVTDPDAGETITATLKLVDAGAGVLTADSGNGETYDPGMGVWTVTGTVAQVNAALASVAFVPSANSSVNTTITTSIRDLAGTGPANGVITLTGTPVNDVPSFTMAGNQNVLEDSGPHTVAGFASALPGGGADESGQTFTYSISSDNPSLFLVAPTIDASGTLTYTLNPNVNGTARVTVSVTDSGGTANGGVDTSADQTFDIIVGAVNDVPSFTMAGNQNVLEDSGPHTVAGFASALPGGGADESGQTFTYSISSDNPSLFLVAPTIDASGTLTYTLNPNVNGTARVTVSVTDSGGTANGGVDTSADQTFDIIVGAVNDVPSFTMAGNQNVLEDSGPHSVAGFASALPGGGADESGQTFTYSISSDNPGLFLVAPTIDASGTLTYTLNPNVNGTARVTVSVTDSGGTANGGVDTSADQTFDIIVGAVNDVPSFTMAGNQNVLEDSGPHTVAGFASALPGGGADESGQTFTYSISSDNPSLFLVAPTIDASGTLTYTLNPNVNGTARVTVSVTDSGGTANGGVDTSADQTFDIIVGAVNDVPSFTMAGNQNVLEDSGPHSVAGFASALPGGGGDESGQTFTYSISSDNPGLFLVAPTIDASGTLTYTLNPNANGTARVTVSVTDSGGTANGGVDTSADQTFDIIVGAVNDAPMPNPGGPYTINEGGQLDLDASGSSDVDTDPLTFEWDLSYDGVTFNPEASGDMPSLSWLMLQGAGLGDDGVYTVAVRANDGTTTAIRQTTLTIVNVAPTLTVSGAGAAVAGGSYTLTLTDSDPGADMITSWTINWGDGTVRTYAGDPASVTHTYTGAGFTYDILVSATDEDGTWLQNELLVASYNNGDGIFRFEGTTGAFLQLFATADGLDDPIEAIIGPDGNLYVTGENSDTVLRYNATTGAFIDVFVSFRDGGLRSPGGLAFGPDGNLYVASYSTDEVLRYDGVTGDFVDAFVTAGSGGLDQAYGLAFGPDGNLYVNSFNQNEVLRYDGTTGAFIDEFVAPGSGGLDDPEQMIFGPDGNLYIASLGSDEVLRFHGTTGVFLGAFVTAGLGGLDEPSGLAFGPDGNLYVSDFRDAVILRYNGVTGTFIDEYVTAGSGGLESPTFVQFLPQQQVSVSDSSIAPTLTVFANPVETTLEDTLVEISYTDLVLAGDEADADGNVVAFVVRNVTSGTLLIGVNPGTATPWAAGSNDTVDAVNNAYWLPASNTAGAQNAFAVVAKDDDGLESAASVAVQLGVTAVNDVPSFTMAGNQNVLEDSGPHTVAGFASALPGGGVDESGQTFTYSVSSDNPGLFLVAPTIDASGTLTYTLNPNVSGTARVTVSVTDSGGTANGGVDTSADQTFDIIVGAVNDVPSFTMAGNQNVLEDTGPHSVAGFATALPGGGADESGQTFAYSVSSDNPGLFLVAPTIDASGTLTYTLNPNVSGTARVTVSVSDSGGTANGGVDTSADQTFDIVVGAVNDIPSFTMLGNQTVPEDSGPHSVAGFATALPGGGADEAGQTFTYSVSSDNPGLFLVAPTIDASGTLTYTLNPNVSGTARVTVSVSDSGGTANGGVDTSADQTFDIVVGAVNDIPSFTMLGNQTVAEDSGPHSVAGFATALPGGGADEAGQTFTYSVSSDNPGLFLVAPTIDASGTLTYTLNPNVSGTARVTVSVSDSGGTANGGVDTSATQTFDIAVTPSVGLPSASNLDQALVYLEDSGPVDLNDILVSVGGGSGLVSATLSLANIDTGALSADSGNGETYSAATGIWTVTGTVTQVNAALAAVVFTPSLNNDVDTVVSSAVRNAGGALAAQGLITLNVVPVNDAPVGLDNLLALPANTPYALSPADFGFSDPVEGHNWLGVRIISLPSLNVSLLNNGVPVLQGDTISAADIRAGRLQLVTLRSDADNGLTSLSFQVQDSGGSLAGGQDFDTVVRNLAVLVIPDNIPESETTPRADSASPEAADAGLAQTDDADPSAEPPPQVAALQFDLPGELTRAAPVPVTVDAPRAASVTLFPTQLDSTVAFEPESTQATTAEALQIPALEIAPTELRTYPPSPSQDSAAAILDQIRDALDEDITQSEVLIARTAAGVVGLSVGYISWLLRGGILLSTVLSSMPVWRFVDPLPVFLRDRRQEDDDDDESLESIVQSGSTTNERGSKTSAPPAA